MKRLPLNLRGYSAALLLVVLGLAGCGGSGDPSAAPTPSTYAECLQQQGVEMPTGRPSGGTGVRPSGGARPSGEARPSGTPVPRASGMDGQGSEAMQKAMQACSALRPSGDARPGGGNTEALTAYVNCLKDKGITWNPGDPAPTAEAAKVCEVLRPSRPATN